ncbi:MAG: YdeI/OmpD-associated family protein [Chthonomonadales bacterium]
MPKTNSNIQFSAKLFLPAEIQEGETWTFLKLPIEASEKLPARSQVSVEGTFNGHSFVATLDPDGEGGHWLKVSEALRTTAEANVGDMISLIISPVKVEPEPEVPDDFRAAIDANPIAQDTWQVITPIARRDWIKWVTSGKKAETRLIRIEKACDKLGKGSRRPCCFDRSGMYDKSLSCPVADNTAESNEN